MTTTLDHRRAAQCERYVQHCLADLLHAPVSDLGATMLYVHAASWDARLQSATSDRLAALATAAAECENVTLGGGLAGVAWVAAHAERVLGISVFDDESFHEVDAVILEGIDRPDAEYDLLSGVVGWILYALERPQNSNTTELLEKLTAALGRMIQETEVGRGWWTNHAANSQRPGKGRFDFGMAHGVVGIISVLGEVCRRNPSEATMTLLEFAVSQLTPYITDAERLPSWITEQGRIRGPWMAWCYSTLIAGSTIFWAGQKLGRAGWATQGLELVRRAVAHEREEQGGIDASICHGSAGIAHILNRVAQSSGDEDIAASSRRWLTRTADLVASRASSPERTIGHRWMGGLLYGSAGISLVFMGATSARAPQWDRLLGIG